MQGHGGRGNGRGPGLIGVRVHLDEDECPAFVELGGNREHVPSHLRVVLLIVLAERSAKAEKGPDPAAEGGGRGLEVAEIGLVGADECLQLVVAQRGAEGRVEMRAGLVKVTFFHRDEGGLCGRQHRLEERIGLLRHAVVADGHEHPQHAGDQPEHARGRGDSHAPQAPARAGDKHDRRAADEKRQDAQTGDEAEQPQDKRDDGEDGSPRVEGLLKLWTLIERGVGILGHGGRIPD